jgi:WD40 repeat protein
VTLLGLREQGKELVSAGHDGTVRRWEAATGKSLTSAEPYAGRTGFAIAPNRRWLALADSKGRLEIWDLVTKTLRHRMESRGRAENSLGFSPDGKLLAVAALEGTSGICDWERGTWIHDLPRTARAPPRTWRIELGRDLVYARWQESDLLQTLARHLDVGDWNVEESLAREGN